MENHAIPLRRFFIAGALAHGLMGTGAAARAAEIRADDLAKIETIVVLYAENRSFDNLFGTFPGARGLDEAKDAPPQVDRDGSVLSQLPRIWSGLTARRGVARTIAEAQTTDLPNAPFAIDDPNGFNVPITIPTRDLVHRFYQNQMQIDDGKNDRFVAWGDSGGLAVGYYYAGSRMKLWQIAEHYTLADNF